MNLDDLKPAWKLHQSTAADAHLDKHLSSVIAQSSWLNRVILRRDVIETVVIFALVLFFGFLFVWQWGWHWIAKLGLTIIILGCVEIGIILHWTRRRQRRSRRHVPLAEFVASEISHLDRQVWLLRYVNWWYSGPILLGCCIFSFGLLHSIGDLPNGVFAGALAVCYVFYGTVAFYVHRKNQRCVRTELQPVRQDLADVYHQLSDDPGSDVEFGSSSS